MCAPCHGSAAAPGGPCPDQIFEVNVIGLPSMTLAEYAAYERDMGARVAESGGVFWRRVRPLFYRPLFLLEPLDAGGVTPPAEARWGGWQFVVGDPARANGSIDVLLFRNASAYSLDRLEKKRRWEVRTAQRHFTVRRIESPRELTEAHPAYVDFQRRTRYGYRSDRVDARRFAEWAQAVFRHPKVRVLGAWEGGTLRAVSVLQRVGTTLLYSTFFASSGALHRHVASLMLHEVRRLAAESGCVDQVFAGLRKAGREASVDEFYLQRGCEIVRLPACLRVHPLTGWCLRMIRPGLWRRLSGERVGVAESAKAGRASSCLSAGSR